MELKNPEYLCGILVFALLLFLLTKTRKKGYYYSGQLAVKKIGLWWKLVIILPTLLYIGAVSLLFLALAAPYTRNTKTETIIEGKVLIPCIDVSGSMDDKITDGRSKLQAIKDILKDFLETRDQVDSVGLTAFSGGGDGWGAGIIQRPTLSKEVFTAASSKVTSQLFGGSTAIGEGIFISILALNEMEWHGKTQQESGNPDSEFNIQRLWAAVNTLDLPESGLPNTDAKTRDDFIISETARLTPPEKNKNKVIILFSDGDSNTGLDPIKAIWLAERLGIKIYYIEVVSGQSQPVPIDGETASLSMDSAQKKSKHWFTITLVQTTESRDYGDLPEHRRNLVTAIKKTGGEYFRGQNYADVQRFFMEISKLEKDKITIVNKYDINESYEFLVLLAAILFGCLIVIEVLLNI